VRSEHELARYRDQLEDLVHQRTAELEAVNERLHREDRRLRAMLALSQRASALDERQLFRLGLDEILRADRQQRRLRAQRAQWRRAVLQLQAWAGTRRAAARGLLAQRVLASAARPASWTARPRLSCACATSGCTAWWARRCTKAAAW
jgi:hypothetical protein